MLYVALTRAQSQVVTWWAPTAEHPDGGLHRLLFGAATRSRRRARPTQVLRTTSYAARVLGPLGDAAAGPTVEASSRGRRPLDRRTGRPTPGCALGTFDRRVDTDWRRTSYCGLIRAAETGTPRGRQRARGAGGTTTNDRRAEPGGRPADAGAAVAVPSPMADLPAGATFGTLVHARARAHRPRGARPAGRARRRGPPSSCAGRPGAGHAPTSWPTALVPLHCDPARPARRRPHAAATSRWATGWPSSTSRSPSPAATPRGVDGPLVATSPRCCARTCPPTTRCRLRRPLEQPGARRPAAARLSVGHHRRGAPGARAAATGSWSSTTRPTSSARPG